MPEPVKLPIRDNVGAALRFVRENWRFVAITAAVAAAAQGLGLFVLGSSLVGVLLVGLITAAAYAALTRAALSGPQPIQPGLAADGARVFAAMAAIGFFLSLIVIMLVFVAMSVLIAPYDAEV